MCEKSLELGSLPKQEGYSVPLFPLFLSINSPSLDRALSLPCSFWYLGKGELQPLPGALVVEEEDQVEMLPCFLSHLLSQLQYLQGGHRNGDTMVEHPFPGHLRINDLPRAGGKISGIGGSHLYDVW